MSWFYKMMKKDSKGFTLVELMVVLLILGILVAIAIPIYNSTQKNAKVNADKANVRTLNGSTAQWASETGADLSTAVEADIKAALEADYLKDWPDNPFGGTYDYSWDTTNTEWISDAAATEW